MPFDYNYTWSDVVGNIGVVMLIGTLWLNVSGRIDSKGWEYNLSNLTVAILLSVNLYYKPNMSSIIIEMFWAGISLYGLYKYYRLNRKNKV
jgi:hypothetical protein